MSVRRPLVALTLVFGALTAAWGALLMLDSFARAEARTVSPLELREGGVVVSVGSGDLDVIASAGPPRIEVDSVSGLFGSGTVRVGRDAAGRISIEGECPGFISSACSTSARVYVPAGASLDLSTGSGELAVRGVRGGVVAQTGSGDVLLDRVGGGVVTAETGSGEVRAIGVSATESLRAETGSGDVLMSLDRAPKDTAVDTGSGVVEMTVPDVVYRVSTETGSGEQQVTVDNDDDAPRRLRVETGSGDVVVQPAG